MPRKTSEMYSKSSLQQIATHLNRLATQIREAAEGLEDAGLDRVRIGHLSEMTRGMEGLEKFASEARLSVLRETRTRTFGPVTDGNESPPSGTDAKELTSQESADAKRRKKRTK